MTDEDHAFKQLCTWYMIGHSAGEIQKRYRDGAQMVQSLSKEDYDQLLVMCKDDEQLRKLVKFLRGM
jgi:hypothetical protein